MTKCPSCHSTNCYNSGFVIECGTAGCQFFSEKQLEPETAADTEAGMYWVPPAGTSEYYNYTYFTGSAPSSDPDQNSAERGTAIDKIRAQLSEYINGKNQWEGHGIAASVPSKTEGGYYYDISYKKGYGYYGVCRDDFRHDTVWIGCYRPSINDVKKDIEAHRRLTTDQTGDRYLLPWGSDRGRFESVCSTKPQATVADEEPGPGNGTYFTEKQETVPDPVCTSRSGIDLVTTMAGMYLAGLDEAKQDVKEYQSLIGLNSFDNYLEPWRRDGYDICHTPGHGYWGTSTGTGWVGKYRPSIYEAKQDVEDHRTGTGPALTTDYFPQRYKSDARDKEVEDQTAGAEAIVLLRQALAKSGGTSDTEVARFETEVREYLMSIKGPDTD